MARPFSILCDLDGVIHRASKPIPGAARFVRQLRESGRKYVFLTNSPDHSPRELHDALEKMGVDIPEDHFYTTSQALGAFLKQHARSPRVYMVGSKALREELKRSGVRFTDKRPEFVIFCTGGAYNVAEINKVVQLVQRGANLLTASAETTSLTEKGHLAGNGALIAPIERATKQSAYVIGKPNHFMIRQAEKIWDISPGETLIIGDNLDSDVDIGMQAQMKTVLVLSGNTRRIDLRRSPYKPDYIFANVGRIDLRKLP